MKKRAVLLTPVVPGHTGNGLSMRAGVWLEALSVDHDVDLVVVPLYVAASSAANWARSFASTVRVFRPNPQLLLTSHDEAQLHELSSSAEITVVFRNVLSHLAPKDSPYRLLDLDDLDWIRESRLGNVSAAAGERRQFDENVFRYTTVSVANPFDVTECAEASHGVQVITIPNVIREPNIVMEQQLQSDIDLLFVATLGYQPNEDAALWFLDHVLPQLAGARVALIGANPTPNLLSRAKEDVIVASNVDDLAPWYARANVVIVPVLSGSGTRIKVLEAWSYGVPVVSTKLGVEGLEASGAALIVDSPEEFARACQELLENDICRTELIINGRVRLDDHKLATVTNALAQLLNTRKAS